MTTSKLGGENRFSTLRQTTSSTDGWFISRAIVNNFLSQLNSEVFIPEVAAPQHKQNTRLSTVETTVLIEQQEKISRWSEVII